MGRPTLLRRLLTLIFALILALISALIQPTTAVLTKSEPYRILSTATSTPHPTRGTRGGADSQVLRQVSRRGSDATHLRRLGSRLVRRFPVAQPAQVWVWLGAAPIFLLTNSPTRKGISDFEDQVQRKPLRETHAEWVACPALSRAIRPRTKHDRSPSQGRPNDYRRRCLILGAQA